jgi:hypothetical protein
MKQKKHPNKEDAQNDKKIQKEDHCNKHGEAKQVALLQVERKCVIVAKIVAWGCRRFKM